VVTNIQNITDLKTFKFSTKDKIFLAIAPDNVQTDCKLTIHAGSWV